jgi:glycosyltransferase involved in cell wall biosynthesis
MMLEFALPKLLRSVPEVSILLIGRDGNAFKKKLTEAQPDLADRIHATGGQPEIAISTALSSCDLMVQPYPDGISSRRTSTMAALLHERAVITTSGESTEPIWSDAEAVVIVPAGDTEALYGAMRRLIGDRYEHGRVASAGKRLYDERFALRHTLDVLQRTACA